MQDKNHKFHELVTSLMETAVPPLQPHLPTPPAPLTDATLRLVSSPAALAHLVAQLATEPRIAVDVEAHAQHSYEGLTCLIQMSTGCDLCVVRVRF